MFWSDALKFQNFEVNERELIFFELKKFTLEAIVQVARSIGTKSLETNRIFSLEGLSDAFTNTDLKPHNNNLQNIKHRFLGVNTYKAF